jgi:hypothetical protein
MNGHFSLFFGNGMIRYLFPKVNLGTESIYFPPRRIKRLTPSLKNGQKWGQAAFSGEKARKSGEFPFFARTFYKDCLLSFCGKSSLFPFLRK